MNARDGLRVIWADDDEADLSWCECNGDSSVHSHEVLYAAVVGPDSTRALASLGGIVDADAAYRAEIEADLITEALDTLERERVAQAKPFRDALSEMWVETDAFDRAFTEGNGVAAVYHLLRANGSLGKATALASTSGIADADQAIGECLAGIDRRYQKMMRIGHVKRCLCDCAGPRVSDTIRGEGAPAFTGGK